MVSNEKENKNQKKTLPRKHVKGHLTEQQLLFCKRYVLNGGNAAKSARESGFSEWYGAVQLLDRADVQKEISRLRAERAKKFDLSADRVILELTRVAFGTLGDFVTLSPTGTPRIDCEDVGVDEMAAVKEVTEEVYYERTGVDDETEPVKKTKIKLHNKVEALDKLCRILGLYSGDGGTEQDSPEARAAKIRRMVQEIERVDGLRA